MLLLHVGGLVVRRITSVAVPGTGRGLSLQAVLRPGALLATPPWPAACRCLFRTCLIAHPAPDPGTAGPWRGGGRQAVVEGAGRPGAGWLVDQAVAGNLDLQQATLRLQAVRIVAGTSDSRFLPEISASAKQVQDAAAVDTYFHAGIEAIWDWACSAPPRVRS